MEIYQQITNNRKEWVTVPSNIVLCVDFFVVAGQKEALSAKDTGKSQNNKERNILCITMISGRDPFGAHVGILTSYLNKLSPKRILPLQVLCPPGRYHQFQLVKIHISGHLLRINTSCPVSCFFVAMWNQIQDPIKPKQTEKLVSG